MATYKKIIYPIVLLTIFLLAACSGFGNSDAKLIELAVKATVEAMPTQAPQVIEVTRIVEVTAAAGANAGETEADNSNPGVDTNAGAGETTEAATEAAAGAVVTPESAEEAADDSSPDATVAVAGCPVTSERQFELVSMAGIDNNHPDSQHADLNLSLRGYERVEAALDLVDLGGVDPDAPQFAGIFTDGRRAAFTSAYQVYGWDWDCSEHGCPSELVSDYEVSLLGLATTAGEELRVPSRGPEINEGGFIAAVLYAEANRITLAYSRDGTVATAYTVHLENVCVDSNLLAAYQSANANGRGELPALKNGDVLGSAAADEIQVAVRDKGTFFDPRSRGDWWKGY